jgi:hypothetical protein
MSKMRVPAGLAPGEGRPPSVSSYGGEGAYALVSLLVRTLTL